MVVYIGKGDVSKRVGVEKGVLHICIDSYLSNRTLEVKVIGEIQVVHVMGNCTMKGADPTILGIEKGMGFWFSLKCNEKNGLPPKISDLIAR